MSAWMTGQTEMRKQSNTENGPPPSITNLIRFKSVSRSAFNSTPLKCASVGRHLLSGLPILTFLSARPNQRMGKNVLTLSDTSTTKRKSSVTVLPDVRIESTKGFFQLDRRRDNAQ